MTAFYSTQQYQINEPRAEYGTFQSVRTVTVTANRQNNHTVPSITLSGQWLAEAGFTIGSAVEVQAFKNGVKLFIDQSE